MSSAFTEYATPSKSVAFSEEHFAMHRIYQLPELTLPTIAEKQSVFFTGFSEEEVFTASGGLIVPGEVVPHYADLQPVTCQMQKEFDRGMCSVLVGFLHLGKEHRVQYSLRKVSLQLLKYLMQLDITLE